MVDNTERVNVLVPEVKCMVTNMVDKLDTSCGSEYSIICKGLEYHKICARWVSKQLTDEHKWACGDVHAIFTTIL